MSKAIENRLKIQRIRQRMLSGEISYSEARTEAQPVINEINATSKRLAKKYGVPSGKVSFAALMR